VLFYLFSSQTFQVALVIPVSFPDVIRTFTPTVRTTLIDAIPAFRIAKNPPLTHKNFAINNYMELDFCLLLFYIHKYFKARAVNPKFEFSLIKT